MCQEDIDVAADFDYLRGARSLVQSMKLLLSYLRPGEAER